MNRIIKIIHVVLTVIAWVIFLSSLIRIAVVWNSLPDMLGVHFDSNGDFDVTDSKKYIAYPCLISLAALAFFEISALLSRKINIGMNISEKGDRQIRTMLSMLFDMSKLLFSFFFSGIWIDCVIRQYPLNPDIPTVITLMLLFLFLLFVIISIVIRSKNPPDKSNHST